jgi:hypothetical protein
MLEYASREIRRQRDRTVFRDGMEGMHTGECISLETPEGCITWSGAEALELTTNGDASGRTHQGSSAGDGGIRGCMLTVHDVHGGRSRIGEGMHTMAYAHHWTCGETGT